MNKTRYCTLTTYVSHLLTPLRTYVISTHDTLETMDVSLAPSTHRKHRRQLLPTIALSYLYLLLIANARRQRERPRHQLRSRHRGRPRSTGPHRPPTCSPSSRGR